MSGAAVMATTLHEAAEIGDVEAVRRLVADGADMEEPDEQEVKPLRVAAMFGKLEAMKLPVELGADMEASELLDRRRCMWWRSKGITRKPRRGCWWSWQRTLGLGRMVARRSSR